MTQFFIIKIKHLSVEEQVLCLSQNINIKLQTFHTNNIW
jgi:hypothetical protein